MYQSMQNHAQKPEPTPTATNIDVTGSTGMQWVSSKLIFSKVQFIIE